LGMISFNPCMHSFDYAVSLSSSVHPPDSGNCPLARGAAPLVVALGALILAGEALGGVAVAGLSLASASIMSLAFERRLPRGADAKPVLTAFKFPGNYGDEKLNVRKYD
ncbi:MAG: hypothetical protein KAR37_16730, partial [Alphaproteobacteria bacterium]|nr:hypothetical protein [Alphaproteobacteria bacterium]